MPEDPMLLACVRDGLPHLENLAMRMNALPAEHALLQSGITYNDIAWFRRELPRLITITRGLLTPASDSLDPDDISAAARIRAKTADPYKGCMRWTGGTMGAGKRGNPSPTISYKNKMVPARRLAWQLRYRGTDMELGPNDRLIGDGCYAGSLCMNLAHWRRSVRRPDMGAVRRVLEASPIESDGKLCAARLHWIPRASDGCPACRAVSAHGRAEVQDAAERAGLALRQALRKAQQATP